MNTKKLLTLIVEEHRIDAQITCKEDCWCWDIEQAILKLESQQKSNTHGK